MRRPGCPDRFFDLHVVRPMQQAVNGALAGDAQRRADGLAQAVQQLEPLGAPDGD